MSKLFSIIVRGYLEKEYEARKNNQTWNAVAFAQSSKTSAEQGVMELHALRAAEEPGKSELKPQSADVVRPEDGGAGTASSSSYSRPKRRKSSG